MADSKSGIYITDLSYDIIKKQSRVNIYAYPLKIDEIKANKGGVTDSDLKAEPELVITIPIKELKVLKDKVNKIATYYSKMNKSNGKMQTGILSGFRSFRNALSRWCSSAWFSYTLGANVPGTIMKEIKRQSPLPVMTLTFKETEKTIAFRTVSDIKDFARLISKIGKETS